MEEVRGQRMVVACPARNARQVGPDRSGAGSMPPSLGICPTVDGAEAVILGCTETGMLLDASNSPLPVFDTTLIHVETALTWGADRV